MSVAVYPRLNDLLRARNLTVAELERQIERRFGLAVDTKTLYRLTHTEPVQRADLEIAGAAAAVLGVGLDDLFDVQAIPVTHEEADADALDPVRSRRLSDLFDRRARGTISDAEQAELATLVTEYGQQLHGQRLREFAAARGISIERARREVDADLGEALQWWRAFEAEPGRRRAAAAQARRRRASHRE